MKSVEMRLTVTRYKSGETHTSKYEAELRLTDSTTVGDIGAFTKNCKTIWSKAIEAKREWEKNYVPLIPDIDVEVISSTYDGWCDPGKELVQKSFNRWHTRNIDDISTEKGEESVYLIPDTRYTSEYWDLLIQRDVLDGLSNI